MKYRISQTNKVLSVFLIVMFICSLTISGINSTYTVKSVSIEDEMTTSNSQSTMNTAITPNLGSNISPDLAGEFFDPIPIQMNNGGNYRQGSVSFDLNNTWPSITYSFNISVSSPVKITLTEQVTDSIDLGQYEVYYDVLNPFGDFIGYASSFETGGFPIVFEFPVGNPGEFIFSVGAFDFINYDLMESLALTVTIDHYEPGKAVGNQNSDFFQSDPYNLIINAENTLTNLGYFNLQASSLNLGALNPNSTDFVSGISHAIYGLINSAEYIIQTNQPTVIELENSAIEYAKLARLLLLEIYNNRYIGQFGEGFIYSPTDASSTGDGSFPGDYAGYLKDNAYTLVAINEILYFEQKYVVDPSGYAILDLAVESDFFDEVIFDLFKVGIGDYRERVVVTGYNPLNDGVMDFNDYTSLSHGTNTYLESLAIVAELWYWQGSFDTSIIIDFNTENTEIINFIQQNLTLSSIDTISFSTGGIYAEYYTGTSASNSSSLIGNAHYLSHLASQAKIPQSISVIGSTPEAYRTVMTDTMDNVLRAFDDNVDDSQLLMSRLNTTSISDSERKISTVDNTAMIFAINRLSVVYSETYFESDSDVLQSAWKTRSLDGILDLLDIMYKSDFNLFYPTLNLRSNLFTVDESQVDGNLLITNMYIRSVLSDMLPLELVTITENNVIVGNQGSVSLNLNGIAKVGTWIFFDPFKGIEADIKITIPKFEYTATTSVDLGADFFDSQIESSGQNLNFLYDVEERGDYEVWIEISSEGIVLMTQVVNLVALGETSLEFGLQRFDLTDTTFTTDISYIDETGGILSALQVQGSLGNPISVNQAEFDQKYIRTVRTDSSGKLEMTFNIKDLVKDGIINSTSLFEQTPIPTFTSIKLFLNVTNAESFNLNSEVLVVDVQIRLSRVTLRTSPSTLQLTQGTTDSFTFSVTALDEDQNPISNAILDYSILELPNVSNQVITDADGEATITLRDSDLFALSDLAIWLNNERVVNGGERGEVNATIRMSFTAENYPTKIIHREISILPNDLVITANPVQLSVKEKNILQSEVTPIEIEVATSDLFSRVVNSFVSLQWNETANPRYSLNELNSFVNLDAAGRHVSPYTFNLDPSSLPAGEYSLLIVAVKDGITSTVAIETVRPDDGLSTSQEGQIVIPKVTAKRIVVVSSTMEDVLITAFSLIMALLLTQGLRFAATLAFEKLIMRECPHCGEPVSRSAKVCKYCGRDTNFKTLKNKLSKSGDTGSSNGTSSSGDEQAKEL